MLAAGLAGAGLAAIALFATRRLDRLALARASLLALAIILSIYIGAWLVVAPDGRALIDIAGAAFALLLCAVLLNREPRLPAAFITAHALYDLFFALQAGLPEWYPCLCLGFDVTLGLGLIWLLRPPRQIGA